MYVPAKNLPAISIPAPFAKIIRIQLTKNGSANDIVVYLRPIFSARIPQGKAPKKAPMAKKEPIHGSIMTKEILVRKLMNYQNVIREEKGNLHLCIVW